MTKTSSVGSKSTRVTNVTTGETRPSCESVGRATGQAFRLSVVRFLNDYVIKQLPADCFIAKSFSAYKLRTAFQNLASAGRNADGSTKEKSDTKKLAFEAVAHFVKVHSKVDDEAKIDLILKSAGIYQCFADMTKNALSDSIEVLFESGIDQKSKVTIALKSAALGVFVGRKTREMYREISPYQAILTGSKKRNSDASSIATDIEEIQSRLETECKPPAGSVAPEGYLKLLWSEVRAEKSRLMQMAVERVFRGDPYSAIGRLEEIHRTLVEAKNGLGHQSDDLSLLLEIVRKEKLARASALASRSKAGGFYQNRDAACQRSRLNIKHRRGNGG